MTRRECYEDGADRVRRVTPLLPADEPIGPRKRREALDTIARFLREHDLTQADAAAGIGEDEERVKAVVVDDAALPEGERDELVRMLCDWVEREHRAREAQAPTGFITTRPAERLIAIAERLTERPDIAIAHAPSGVGKSTAIAAITAEIPTSHSVRVRSRSRRPKPLLKQMCVDVARRKYRPDRGFEDVIAALTRPARRRTVSLLIVDDAHKLDIESLELLTEVHDEAECSILLVATTDLRATLSTADDPLFGQIASRVGMRIDLAPELANFTPGGTGGRKVTFTVDDIRKLFRGTKLKLHPDTTRMLARLANSMRGTLRRVSRLVYWGERIAQREGAGMILPAHIEMAGAVVEPEQDLGAYAADMDVAQAEAAIA